MPPPDPILRPFRRCSSDGVSGAVDPTGKILAREATGADGVVRMVLPDPSGLRRDTVYARHGGWLFGWACIAATAAAAGAALAPESALGELRRVLGAPEKGAGESGAAAVGGGGGDGAAAESGVETPVPGTPEKGRGPGRAGGAGHGGPTRGGGSAAAAAARRSSGGGDDDDDDHRAADEEGGYAEDAPLLVSTR